MSIRRVRVALAIAVILGSGWQVSGAPQAMPAVWPPPIDPQVVRDQYDMTWGDYVPIPGTTWNDPTRVASVKTIRLAILAADFPDQPFLMTMPKGSDKYGNPRASSAKTSSSTHRTSTQSHRRTIKATRRTNTGWNNRPISTAAAPCPSMRNPRPRR
jgi:hypothetical protein